MKKFLVCLFFLFLVHFFTSETLSPSLGATAGAPPVIYSKEMNLLQDTFIHAILESKQSIVLMIYTLKDVKIIDALNNQAKQGVKVKVIYDEKASPGVAKKLVREIVKIPRGQDGLMHLKILVIDGISTWLGSANLTQESLKYQANLVVNVHDRAFANAALEKAEQLSSSGFGKPVTPKLFMIGDQSMELHFLPDNENAIQKTKDLIRSAKKTILVAMYTFTREDLANTLIRQAKRGVKVDVVIDRGTSLGASKKIVQLFKDENIQVRFYEKGSLMHHKFILIDDETLMHGSANWTKAAFKQNDDCFMILYKLSKPQVKAIKCAL